MTWKFVMNIRIAAQELDGMVVIITTALLKMENSVVNATLPEWNAIKNTSNYAHGPHGKMNTMKMTTVTS